MDIIENKGPGRRSRGDLLATASRAPMAIQQALPTAPAPRDRRQDYDALVRISQQQTVLRHLHPRAQRAAYEDVV